MTGRGRRRVLTPDEVRVWRAVAGTAVPLPGRTLPEEDIPEPPPPAAAEPAPPPRPLPPARPSQPAPRTLPDLAHGATPGLDKRSSERMKKGEMEIEARLDLHGMTQDSAHAALLGFIARAFDAGRRCVLVITGKGNRDGKVFREGMGVLRANVPRWLNQSPCRERILGFSHARPQHGGEGALYVLIKRRR